MFEHQPTFILPVIAGEPLLGETQPLLSHEFLSSCHPLTFAADITQLSLHLLDKCFAWRGAKLLQGTPWPLFVTCDLVGRCCEKLRDEAFS